MSVSFSGINIITKDPAKSFEFYKGIGLTVKAEAEPDDQYYGAEFDLGGSVLWIWRGDSNSTENLPEPPIKIVFHCDDIDKTYADLKSTGYAVTEPELMFYGGKEMKLTDPDGNRILFLD